MAQKPKKVTVFIRGSSFAGVRASEALRMSVGLTLCDDEIRVVFVEDGVYTLLDGSVDKHVQTLLQLKKALFAHEESMRERGITKPIYSVSAASTGDLARLAGESDVVISW